MPNDHPPQSSIILYQTEDGRTRIQCRFEGETIWLTQVQIAELFQTSVPNINLHLKAIYAERELTEEATIQSYLIVRTEGARQVSRQVLHYSLPAILAVGYRVRSHRGTQFRQWASARLNEYLVKGFTMDDERLKNPPGKGHTDYFDELLERIWKTLNRIVNLYIEFGELQALDRRPMTMRDRIEKLDEFLKISGRELLNHAGKVSAEMARAKAEREYDRYRTLIDTQPRPVDVDFEQAVKQVERLPRPRKQCEGACAFRG